MRDQLHVLAGIARRSCGECAAGRYVADLAVFMVSRKQERTNAANAVNAEMLETYAKHARNQCQEVSASDTASCPLAHSCNERVYQCVLLVRLMA